MTIYVAIITDGCGERFSIMCESERSVVQDVIDHLMIDKKTKEQMSRHSFSDIKSIIEFRSIYATIDSDFNVVFRYLI